MHSSLHQSNDVDEIVNTIYLISGSFGGVNLEDISIADILRLRKKLKEKCDIPIFHDDQHRYSDYHSCRSDQRTGDCRKRKRRCSYRYEQTGCNFYARLLLTAGFKDITLCDRKCNLRGTLKANQNQDEMAKVTNLAKIRFSFRCWLAPDVLSVFFAPGAVTTEMVRP